MSSKNGTKKKNNKSEQRTKQLGSKEHKHAKNDVTSSSHSSELLHFEQADIMESSKSSSSFLLVSSLEQEPSIADESLRTDSPLISDVSTFSANHNDNDDASNDVGIRELWTSKSSQSFISPRDEGRRTSTDPVVQNHQRQSDGAEECFLPRRQGKDTETIQLQCDEEEKNDDLSPEAFNPDSLRLLSRELSKTLLRRNSDCHYDSFISTYLTSREAWLHTWPLVLKRIPRDAALELGSHMMMIVTGLELLVHVVQEFCQKKQTNESKNILLGAALLENHVVRTKQIEKLLSSSLNDSDYQKGLQVQTPRNLMRLLLNEWVQIVMESQLRRTVLAQEAMLAAYGLVSYITDVNSTFEALLQVHEQWLLSYVGTTRDSWRRQSTLSVVQDWKLCSASRTSDAEMTCVDGVAVPGYSDDINFGGLRHTLVDTTKLDEGTMLLILTGAKSLPSATRRRILRGTLAALGQDKTLWRPEFIRVAISNLLVILMLDDNAESATLCSSLLIILLLASPTEHLHDHIAMIVDSLEEQPDKAVRIGHPWSKSLLECPLVDMDRFATVLEAVCSMMFSTPDQIAPLALFGSLVDSKEDALDRSREGVFRVLTVCSRHLDATSNGVDMYQRLAPLLLIRRLPSSYFTSIWNQQEPLSDEHQRVFTIIGSQLSKVLRAHASTHVSPSERKLAAEIVGRCLPLELDVSYSAFHLIVLPAFRNVATSITTCDVDIGQSIKDEYRPAKIALYAACCRVPLIANNAPGAMLAVASFALWLIAQQPRSETDEVIECHQGSIEFFVACLTNDVTPIAVGLRQIVSGHGEAVSWLDVSLFGVSLSAEDLDSPSVKLFIWNAYLLVSQCTTGVSWAKKTASWVLNALDESLASSKVAPGHSSAPLQILFVLVQRNKSLDIIQPKQVPKVNRCIRACLTRGAKDDWLAALKLFMSILVALETSTLKCRYQDLVGDAEAEETLALVARIAQGDDPEFRDLAKHLF